MTQAGGPEPPESDLAEMTARRDALRQAASLSGAELRPVLEAAFAELDGAIDALTMLQTHSAVRKAESPSEAVRAERRMLRAVFADAPVPLFMLERDGTVRRVNKRASDMIGSPPAYAAGKPFTVFVDLPGRAAVQTQLAAAARTGQPRRLDCVLLSGQGTVPVSLAVQPVSLPDDADVLVVAAADGAAPDGGPGAQGRASAKAGAARVAAAGAGAARPGAPRAQRKAAQGKPGAAGATAVGPGQPEAAGRVGETAAELAAGDGTAGDGAAGAGLGGAALAGDGADLPAATAHALRTMAQRMDLLTAVTRLLLDNSTFSESLTLQRCARLLAGELASWVIIDVVRGSRLRRQSAVGPSGQESESLARAARGVDPGPGSVPWQVHETGKSLLQARTDDTSVLGAGPDGVPLLMSFGATSILSVPISDGERGYGVVTLCRRASDGQFRIADLGLAEELGTQLAAAIRVDRLFRRRSEVAEALQASLLPRSLPDIPGVELAAAYMGATEGLDVGGDFYDVYRIPGGWGLAIGDVCGKGQEAAAVTAAARHAIRVLARSEPDPVEVLKKANEIIVAEDAGGRFVTAKTAHLAWRGGALHVSLGTAGHPGPAVVRSDGRVEMLGSGGLPLGLFPEAQLAPEDVDLAPGDLLFFYTDGLTETRSPDMRYFEERLTDELVTLAGRSAAEIVAGIQARAEAFSAGEMRDDLTVLALRVTEAM